MRALDLKKMDYLGGFQFQVTEKSAPNCSSSRFIGSYIRRLRQSEGDSIVGCQAQYESQFFRSWVSVGSGQRFISLQSRESHSEPHHHGAFCSYLMGGRVCQACRNQPPLKCSGCGRSLVSERNQNLLRRSMNRPRISY